MQCERLITMTKSWYLHVRDETMAPARMVSFMEQHAERCEICLQDPDLKEEIAKITELVLPESKIPKAVRQKTEQAAQENNKIEDATNGENDSDDSENDSNNSDDSEETEVNDKDLDSNDDPKLVDPPPGRIAID